MIAFVGNDTDDVMQVWVMKPESGNRIMLTHNRERGYTQDCSWSPDGSRIYYDRWFDGPKGVFSVPALGGEEQLVLEDAMSPEILPDGSMLVVRINSEHRYQLFHYWPDSGRLRNYAIEVPPSAFSPSRAIPGGHEALTFGQSLEPGAETGNHVYVVDLLSGQMRPLPVDVRDISTAISTTPLAVTRDGKRALVSVLRGNMYPVVSVPLDGRGASTTILSLTHPAYSLDTGPDNSIYLDQNDRPLELVRFSAGESRGGVRLDRAGERSGRVERIATLAAGVSEEFAVLPDGRAAWTEVTAGRHRVMVVAPGKDAVPLVNTTEETQGPMTAVGSADVAFMIGRRSQAIGLAAWPMAGSRAKFLSTRESWREWRRHPTERRSIAWLRGWSGPCRSPGKHRARSAAATE